MLNSMGPFFEDFNEKNEMITDGRTVTRADIVNFAGVSGDFSPLHMDKEFGKKTMFGENVAHGLCAMVVASGNIERSGVFDQIVAFYGIQDWKFTKPLFFEDTIRVRIKVESKVAGVQPDRGVVNLYLEVINQKDDVLQEGKWKIMVRKIK